MADLKREFDGRRCWNIWNASTLASVSNSRILFWDDPALPAENAQQVKWYCGAEVHQLKIVIGLYGVSGEIIVLGPIKWFDYTDAGLDALAQFVEPFHVVRFLMETTGIYHFTLAWFLQKKLPQSPAVVMNARHISKLMQRTHKSDPIDAGHLAQLARYDELIKPSYIPTPEHAILRDYSRQRAKAVSAATRLKNHIKKILGMHGCHLKVNFQLKWQEQLFQAFLRSRRSLGKFLVSADAESWNSHILVNMELFRPWLTFNPSAEVRRHILFLWQRLAIAECDVFAVEQTIQDVYQLDQEMKMLCASINDAPGIKDFSTIELVGEIGDVRRFPSAAHFLSYAGIGPRGGTSGVKDFGDSQEKVVIADHPNWVCNPRIKLILVRAARVICTSAKGGPDVDDIVAYAKGLIPKKLKYFRLLFKVAAKLARRIYYCLSHNVPYIHHVQTLDVSKGSNRVSRRQKATRKKFILEEQSHRLWANAEKIFEHLNQLRIPQAEILRLRELFYFNAPHGKDIQGMQEV